MLYRDLIPDRQGGRFIASHILIPDGGPVPDTVHFHRIRFQVIYCYRGWVRVVYEDQGPPFVMQPGDCALQPPGIRHRVLECAPGLEVIEVACPAEYETLADSELELPTTPVRTDRDFSGQRFSHREASQASFAPWRIPGLRVARPGSPGGHEWSRQRTRRTAASRTRRKGASGGRDGARRGARVLLRARGIGLLDCEGHGPQAVTAGDAFVVPAGKPHALRACSPDLQLLEVALPAASATTARDASRSRVLGLRVSAGARAA